LGRIHRQQGYIISLLAKVREIHRQQGDLIIFLSVLKLEIKLKNKQFQHTASVSLIRRINQNSRHVVFSFFITILDMKNAR
jgi:cytochrome b561